MADTIIPLINDFAVTSQEGQVPEFVGITENPSEGVQNIPIVYGTRKVEGIRLWTYVPTSNTNLLYCIYALSEGFCRGITNLWIDDVKIEIDYSQVLHRTPIQIGSGQFGGTLEIEFVDGRGGVTQYGSANQLNVGPSSLISRDLLQNKSYDRLCYLVCKFTYSDPSPYKNIPKVSVALEGRRVAPLSSGVLSATLTTNPILILWDLLYNTTYGAGVSYDKQDYTSFNTAAVACASALSARGASSISQFECNWICDTANNLIDNINYLLDSYKITLSLIQGKYTVSLEASPSDSDGSGGGLTFNADNIVSDIQIQYPNLGNKFNKVIVDFPDRDNYYQTRTQIWPVTSTNPYLTEDGNLLLEQRFSADTITSFWGASDMAQMILLRSRTQKIFTFTADKTAHRVRVGDYIFINTTLPLISNEKVIVLSMEMNDDYTFNLECVSYTATNYPIGFTNVPTGSIGSTQQPPGGGGVVVPAPLPNPNPPVIPPATQTFTLAANGSTFNEGSTITWTLTTTNVTDGTVFPWALVSGGQGNLTAADISPSATVGTLTVNSNTATYSVTALSDGVSEGSESWTFRIGSSTNGTTVASSTVIVQDVSVGPPPTQFLYTFAGAPFMDTVNATNVRTANTNWYMAFTNSLNAYDATETANNGNQVTWSGGPPTVSTAYTNNCVRTRLMKTPLNPATGSAYTTFDMDICLIDRLYANRDARRAIYCVYDNFNTYLAGTGAGYLNQNWRALDSQIITFNPAVPPTGANVLKVTRRTSNRFGNTSLNGWERIDNTSTTAPQTNDLPGLIRLSPVTGKPGHYATNLGATSGPYTLKFPVGVGFNQTPLQSDPAAGTGRNCYLGPYQLDSSSISIMTIKVKLIFFEVIPVTNLVVPLGYKVVSVGLNRGCLTAKYYDAGRANLTSTIGAGQTNPMPA